ncbi:MAG TPA: site-specific DNA-methyltransferase, partial [Actinomycetota bacterium]|nr:site-specific DNA-methyltransferase [Actinomycetota bacterium]
NSRASSSVFQPAFSASRLSAIRRARRATGSRWVTRTTGFEFPEIDGLIESATLGETRGGDEEVPEVSAEAAVSRAGDLWKLGRHRLVCGDARDQACYARLLAGERAAMGIHDAPYDLRIGGHVAKRGRHREFVMGSGELGDRFEPFLRDFLLASTGHLVPGGFQFCFMDWRHMGEMLGAGRAAGLELKNLCVWNKGYGGMGSLFRSAHELVFVFRDPNGPLRNNVQLGRFDRNRNNVWDYPGPQSLRKERELHPSPKPVAMIADAIRDVTDRSEIVLDAFSGSGTTIIAAAKVGRRGYAIDLDPLYVDVAVRRWEAWSGETAVHAETGLTFAETAELRAGSAESTIADDDPSTMPAPSFRVRQRARGAA